MWNGYLVIDGTEIANIARTQAYARNLRVPWIRQTGEGAALPVIFGETYRTPLLDDAPWVDPDNPDSLDFLGFAPTSVTGVEDSTGSAEVIEFIGVGGAVGRLRHGTKPVVFAGVLVALTEAGADYGMQWLKSAVIGSPCSSTIFGSQFCYLSSEPEVDMAVTTRGTPASVDGDGGPGTLLDGGDPDGGGDDIIDGGDPFSEPEVITESDDLFTVPGVERLDYSECLTPYMRSLHKFSVVQHPKIDRKQTMSDGGRVWFVQFTGVAGVPWEFSVPAAVLEGYLDPTVIDPIVDPDIDYEVDSEGFVFTDVDCEVPLWGPLYDPLCPVLIAPPAPVDISLSCVDIPSNWQRRQVVIPDAAVPLWSDVVPVVSFRATKGDLRTIRLRFYSDPNETGNPSADPCSYCGDLLVTYIPYQGTLVIDGVTETVYVDMPGGERRRADSLVVGTDGKPFTWPALTCGSQYVMTLDAPRTQVAPVVDLSLVARSK